MGQDRLGDASVMTAAHPSTYTPKPASLPGKHGTFRVVPMILTLRRFRTTRVNAILSSVRSTAFGMAGRATGAPAFGTALAAAMLACRLACAANPAPTEATGGRLFAAGAAAAERGWFAAARGHWRDAAREANATGDRATARRIAQETAHLDAVEREIETAAVARDRAAATAWAAAEWPVSWRTSAGRAACGAVGQVPPLTIIGGLVVWNTGRSLHAVAMSDGRPRWRTADERDTCLFPRSIGGHPTAPLPACTLPPTAAVGGAGRAYAVIDRGHGGHLLACLDLSDAAAARPEPPGSAAGMAACDGPPVADDELCCVVLRADDARGSLALAVFDARDGSPRWTRSLGPAVAGDGGDHARGRRQPCLAEDRIVVDTHAGRLCAFDREGNACWTRATRSPSAGAGREASVSPPRFARGRILLADGDGSGITAVDPRTGDPRWRWPAGETAVAAMLATAGDGVVITTRPRGSGPTTLRRLAAEDGSQTAEFAAGQQPDWAAGRGVVADDTVFWPVAGRAATEETSVRPQRVLLEVLDAVTFERRRPPIDCGPLIDTDDASAAAPDFGSQGPQVAIADGCLVIANQSLTCLRPAPVADRGPAPDTSSR
jgi:outer membrane protein assembly factor BamB